MSDLSILCVTRAEPHALSFLQSMRSVAFATRAELVVAADGDDARLAIERELGLRSVPLHSAGFIESVLDEAIAACTRDYVLRLDDDERCSPAMVRWLADGGYHKEPHWKFARAHLWGDTQRFLLTAQLWPDHQTRLSLRSMAGGRTTIHAGSPHGGGALAPVVLEHHKFLVKDVAERREIVARYERIQPGAGESFQAFSVPEDVYEEVAIAPVGNGTLRHHYGATEIQLVRLREAA